jgi:hypothetical protein
MCMGSSQCFLCVSLLWLGHGLFGIGCWRAGDCPSICPSVCRVLYMAWYSIGESTDVIYYVYGMFAMLLVCISALVRTWTVRNQVLACRGVSVYVSICLSCTLHVSSSLPM